MQKTQIWFTGRSRGVSNALSSSVSHRGANGGVLDNNWKVDVSANNSNGGISSLPSLPLTLLYTSRTKEEGNGGRRAAIDPPFILAIASPIAGKNHEVIERKKGPDSTEWPTSSTSAMPAKYCTVRM